MLEKPIVISKKICMLGSFGVGKTSLVRRFVFNKFEEKYLSTVGVHISKKSILLPQNGATARKEQLNLILWDLAHIEKFDRVIKNYFRGAHGAIVVFDITRSQTFKEHDLFLQPFLDMNPDSKLMFVGNKIDLVDRNAVNVEQLLQISKTYNSLFMMTSAKTNENVEQVFTNLGTSLHRID